MTRIQARFPDARQLALLRRVVLFFPYASTRARQFFRFDFSTVRLFGAALLRRVLCVAVASKACRILEILFIMFSLSGKKKFLVTVIGILSMVAAARFGALQNVIVFIGGTVAAYLVAETALDKQRVLSTIVSTIAYNLEKFQTLPAAITEPLEKAGVQIAAK